MMLASDLGSFNQVLIDLTYSSKWKPGDSVRKNPLAIHGCSDLLFP